MRLFFFVVALLVSGCAVDSVGRHYPATPFGHSDTQTRAVPPVQEGSDYSSGGGSHGDEPPCTFFQGYTDSYGQYVPPFYKCQENSIYPTGSINQCHWVSSYYRSDGVAVSGHYRCKYNIPTSQHDYTGRKAAPPDSSYEYRGPIRVRGYYRKDGTYVRPHTRRRSR